MTDSRDQNKIVQPAIVLGGGLNALGIVRSLADAGVPSIVLDQSALSPAMRSRHATPIVVASLEGDDLVKSLVELSNRYGSRLMLFPTEEKTVASLSSERERLTDRFILRLPHHDRLIALMHKQGFQKLAEEIGAPVPRTVYIQSAKDLEQAAKLKFPCVFKPAEKNYEYGAKFKKAYKLESIEAMAELYERIAPIMPDMIAQEWIEGEDSQIYFCLQYIGQDGELVASFAGRKIRSWPPRIGGTASCTAAWEHADTLSEMTLDFFRKVDFTGMGSMEYKRDSRDGQFYMVEPTVGRTDFQEEVATINGINLPYAAFCYERDHKVATISKPPNPRIWRDPEGDRYSQQEQGGAIDQASANQPVVDAYWRWNDPKPWLDMMRKRVVNRLSR